MITETNYVLWLIGVVFFFTIVVMQWKGKLPQVKSVQDLATALNSRGGNILILGLFSAGFFIASLRFTYWIISRASDGKITVENSVAMAAFTWMTGSAFGGAFTSMVKAMTGENSAARASDTRTTNNGNGKQDQPSPTPALTTPPTTTPVDTVTSTQQTT